MVHCSLGHLGQNTEEISANGRKKEDAQTSYLINLHLAQVYETGPLH